MVRFHMYTWWDLAYLNQFVRGLNAGLYGLERLAYVIV